MPPTEDRQIVSISSERVTWILLDCMIDPESFVEITHRGKIVLVHGFDHRRRFYFDPDMLDRYQEEINAMLDRLPPQYHPATGGGDSPMHMFGFGNSVDPETIQGLFCLGLAIDRLKFVMNRREARQTPDGLPYVVLTS